MGLIPAVGAAVKIVRFTVTLTLRRRYVPFAFRQGVAVPDSL